MNLFWFRKNNFVGYHKLFITIGKRIWNLLNTKLTVSTLCVINQHLVGNVNLMLSSNKLFNAQTKYIIIFFMVHLCICFVWDTVSWQFICIWTTRLNIIIAPFAVSFYHNVRWYAASRFSTNFRLYQLGNLYSKIW